MSEAVIGIGTNIGDRLENIKNALDSLSLLPGTKVIKCSRLYETLPWGYKEQQNFYNCCVLIETELSSRALLGSLLGIEAALGRVRTIKNGPRIIDLDLLLFEDESVSDRELCLPHPRIKERAFVLYPLKDLFESGRFKSFDFSLAFENADENSIIGIL